MQPVESSHLHLRGKHVSFGTRIAKVTLVDCCHIAVCAAVLAERTLSLRSCIARVISETVSRQKHSRTDVADLSCAGKRCTGNIEEVFAAVVMSIQRINTHTLFTI